MYDGVSVSKCLPGLNSQKIAQVTPARVHGLQENVDRLRNSSIMGELAEHPEWMPLLLDEEGNELPFPEPEHALPAMKPRGRRPRSEDSDISAAGAAVPPQQTSEQPESNSGRAGGSNGRGSRGRHSKAEKRQETANGSAAGTRFQKHWW